MAFVHDHLAVFGHHVLHLALSNQTLYDCYIEASGFCGLSASNLADFLAAKAEEERANRSRH
jgi:hypothetical protein